VDLRDLYIFQTVAKERNISRAAKQLHYVQSNVTTRIKGLEEELGTQLFHRHNRGMELTPEGKKLITYAERITALVDEMKKVMQDDGQPAGNLSIGAVETVIKLPLILSRYNQAYKNVDLSLATGVSEELIDRVLNYKLDGAFITGTARSNHPDLKQYHVFEEELVLVTDLDTKTLAEIKERPFLVFGAGCGYRAKLKEWLRDEQIVSSKVMELGTLETILGSVYSGLGVTYLPKSVVAHHEARGLIRCHSLPAKYSRIQTVFICRKDAYQTRSLEAFIEIIEASHDEPTKPAMLPFI